MEHKIDFEQSDREDIEYIPIIQDDHSYIFHHHLIQQVLILYSGADSD